MLVATSLLLLSVVGASRSQFGFGVTRYQNYKSKIIRGTGRCDNVTEYRFKNAVIDNFAPVNEQKLWMGEGQRYWINKQLWGGPGFPIFVFIGGEGEEDCSRLSDYLFMFNLAEEHKGLLVNVEHRFYGESYPTLDMSTESYKYLSSEQALADLARVISFVKEDLQTTSSKVITTSGSYPGNLAAWFRLKYPSLSQGSIASSAPVTAQTNFPEYMDVVAQALLRYSGQACYDAFESAGNTVAQLLNSGAAGMDRLETDFHTCSSMENDLDVAIFLSDLMGNVQGTVQYNDVIAGSTNVKDICDVMLSSADAYANFVKLQAQYRTANGQQCENANWNASIAYLSATAKDPYNMARPWTYQTCNEFGYFQTADSPSQPFHAWTWLNVDLSRKICTAAFDGWSADPQVAWINNVYGSTRIDATNIMFPTGTTDPWHALAVTNETASLLPQPTERSVFIDGTAHCMDLYAPSPSDSPSLTAARQQIAENVALWLK